MQFDETAKILKKKRFIIHKAIKIFKTRLFQSNKAHFQETSSARNNGPSPSPGFINFSYCGKRVNFSRVSKSQKESCPIPMIVQWREDSKIIEASAENDFRFQRLLGMVCTMEWDRILWVIKVLEGLPNLLRVFHEGLTRKTV